MDGAVQAGLHPLPRGVQARFHTLPCGVSAVAGNVRTCASHLIGDLLNGFSGPIDLLFGSCVSHFLSSSFPNIPLAASHLRLAGRSATSPLKGGRKTASGRAGASRDQGCLWTRLGTSRL